GAWRARTTERPSSSQAMSAGPTRGRSASRPNTGTRTPLSPTNSSAVKRLRARRSSPATRIRAASGSAGGGLGGGGGGLGAARSTMMPPRAMRPSVRVPWVWLPGPGEIRHRAGRDALERGLEEQEALEHRAAERPVGPLQPVLGLLLELPGHV